MAPTFCLLVFQLQLKTFISEVIGETADGPRGQIVVILGGHDKPGEMLSQTSSSKFISEVLPLPLAILSSIISSHVVPSRHGVHWPHDSCAKKLTMLFAALTRFVSSSIITTAPEPSIELLLATSSIVIFMSS